MKSVAIISMLILSIYCQSVEPTTHTKYKDDVVVNLKKYSTENKRIRTDLDAQIKRKHELVVEGNAHNKNLKKVTGYVNAWKSDIKKTKEETELFQKSAKLTRQQWKDVKKTQNVAPDAKPTIKPSVVVKATLKPKAAKKEKVALKGLDKKSLPKAAKPTIKPSVVVKATLKPKVAKKEKVALKGLDKKSLPKVAKPTIKPSVAVKATLKPKVAKKEKVALKGLDKKSLPKVAKPTIKPSVAVKATLKPKAAKKEKVALKGLDKKSLPKVKVALKKERRLQKVAPKPAPKPAVDPTPKPETSKTLESVNSKYLAQVDELEKSINHVIAQIRIVYANAEKDDRDAATLQKQEQKTLEELKTFLKHLLEYIGWTRKTMRNYSRLFHTRPDNVFAKKTTMLIKKIRAVL